MLTCCKGDGQSQWKTPIFGPSQLGNPLTVSIKFETDDYVGDANPHANLVIVRLAEARPHIGEFVTPGVYFFTFLFFTF